MAKKIVRLTESDLHRIVKESVQKILREEWHGDKWDTLEDYYFNDNYGSRDIYKGGKHYRIHGPMMYPVDPNETFVFNIYTGKIEDMGKDLESARKYAEEVYRDYGKDYEIYNPNEYENIGDWAHDCKWGLKQIYDESRSENIASRNAEIERYGMPDSYLDTFAD